MRTGYRMKEFRVWIKPYRFLSTFLESACLKFRLECWEAITVRTNMWLRPLAQPIAIAVCIGLMPTWTSGAQACGYRGELDALYCDENHDLVADLPADPRTWKDPATLVFAFTPVEDAAVYQNVFRPFTDYLSQCTGKRVAYYPVQSNTAQIEAMRTGRLHIAGFSTGPTGFAVNLAGAVPFAIKAVGTSPQGYHLIAIVKNDSPYRKLSDLKGKRVAHTSPSSNSGNLAPRVLFPLEGLAPGVDYTPLMSGGHDKSVLGVQSGDYDMAAVASDVFDRVVARATAKRDDFRVLYKSPLFPTSSFAYANDLTPHLVKKLQDCFFAFRFPAAMTQEFGGDRFMPVTYRESWAIVREIAEKTGVPFNRASYETESKREAEEFRKKQQQGTKSP
jgi:phosphonate transport system substrate-binding protein